MLNGEVIGLDLFDCARTLSALLPKLVESAAWDAIDAGEESAQGDGQLAAERFLDAIARAEVERFQAIGDGEDLRLRDQAVTGGALGAEGRVVHLCAFPIHADEGNGNRCEGSRLVRTSQRRRGPL